MYYTPNRNPFWSIIAYIILYLCIMSDTNKNSKPLRCIAWNSRGMNAAKPYLNTLLKDNDIVVISEHQLFHEEIYKLKEICDVSDFQVYVKAKPKPILNTTRYTPGNCGIAIAWRKSLKYKVTPLKDINNDRMCVLMWHVSPGRHIFIIGVYLPHRTCIKDNISDYLSVIAAFIESHRGCEIIIIGDFNCHIGDEFSGRSWGQTCSNGRKLLKLTDSYDLVIKDLYNSSTGPTFSFQNSCGGTSYIDHCVISRSLVDQVRMCGVMEEASENTSDHLPVFAVIDICFENNNNGRKSMRDDITWQKLSETDIRSKYTDKLESYMSDYILKNCMFTSEISTHSKNEIDKCINDIKNMMCLASKLLPHQKPKGHARPYWCPELTVLCRAKKQAWREWVKADRPRNDDSPLWLRYKLTKRELRARQRQLHYQYELNYINKLDKADNIDQKLFWHLINRRLKPRAGNECAFKRPDGQYVTDPITIRDEWRSYFEHIYTPNSNNQDKKFDEHVKQVVADFSANINTDREMHVCNDVIMPGEVEIVCKQLKLNKACGYDGIRAENLRHADKTTYFVLSRVFTAMFLNGYRPECMKRGIIIPIPKGKKDHSDPNNYRGITLLSTLSKVYDKILLKRYENWFRTTLSNLQGVAEKGGSSINTALLLHEAIAHTENTYVALLDVKKAFDSVWIKGLMYKLINLGMDKRLWSVIYDSYNGFKCSVRIAGGLSNWFCPQQGVHQGDVMSMYLFCIYNNDLLNELVSIACPISIAHTMLTCPAFADDIAVAAKSESTLQYIVDEAVEHSIKWRYSFNLDKIRILVFCKNKTECVLLISQ